MANTTISVENPNLGSLHVKLSEISNSLADISLTLSLYPAIKKGIEEPDYTNKFKKINSRIKQLINLIEFLNTKVITLEEFDEIYLKILNFKSKLMSSLDDSIIKNKIKSFFPSLDNYYTKSEVNTIVNEHQPNLEDYYTKSTSYPYTKLYNRFEVEKLIENKIQDYIKNLIKYSSEKILPTDTIPEKIDRLNNTYIQLNGSNLVFNNTTTIRYAVDIYSVNPGEKYEISYRYYGLKPNQPSGWQIATLCTYSNNNYENKSIIINKGTFESDDYIDINDTVIITIPENITHLAIMVMLKDNGLDFYGSTYVLVKKKIIYTESETLLYNTLNTFTNNINDAISNTVSRVYTDPNLEKKHIRIKNNLCEFIFKDDFLQLAFGLNSVSVNINNNNVIIESTGGETDLIGPIALNGYYSEFIGGAHSLTYLNNETHKYEVSCNTYYTDNISIYVDDEAIVENVTKNDIQNLDFDVYGKLCKIIIVSSIYKPTDSNNVTSDGKHVTGILLKSDLTKVCTETLIWTIYDNKATVNVKLKFLTSETIGTYYGMLCKGYGKLGSLETEHILSTTNGKFDLPVYTDRGHLSFLKLDYDRFNEFTLKHCYNNMCESLSLNSFIGIGNHSMVNSDKKIFMDPDDGNRKYYHVLITNKSVEVNDELEWEGTYSFFIDNENIIKVIE